MKGLKRWKVTRQLVDDLDGSPAVAPMRFGYAGRDYEIDLTEAHAAEHDEEGGLDLTGDSPAHGLCSATCRRY